MEGIKLLVDGFNDFFLGNPADEQPLQVSTVSRNTNKNNSNRGTYKPIIPYEAYQCAKVSREAYKTKTERKPILENLIYNETLSSNRIAVYLDLEGDKVKAIIGFRGTQLNPADFMDDLAIILGSDKSIIKIASVERLTKIMSVLSSMNVQEFIFTGHSLGGFIAVLASSETGIPAIVFNIGSSPTQAVRKGADEIGEKLEGIKNNLKKIFDSNIIRSYIMEGDIIAESSIALIPETIVLKPRPGPSNLVEAHSIDYLINNVTPSRGGSIFEPSIGF